MLVVVVVLYGTCTHARPHRCRVMCPTCPRLQLAHGVWRLLRTVQLEEVRYPPLARRVRLDLGVLRIRESFSVLFSLGCGKVSLILAVIIAFFITCTRSFS